ncbi:MAG: hypothetical protein JRH12_21245 [Deltaproteobacteria bacterium]|jgi:hypothetical protein|nr:hypothetical protein [Deltaproteobacteria bacterium]MBW2479150.1 hypothetical protein [Deltaproteobacteria bacterium]
MLNKKPHIENHKILAESKLATRIENLKSKGKTDVQIQRDSAVKHLRAEISQARQQLASIAKLESDIARRAEEKARKLAAPKSEKPKPKPSAQDPMKKKARKEKKIAAAAATEE